MSFRLTRCTSLALAQLNAHAGCLLREEDGQDLIEYALVAGLIGLSAIFSLNAVTGKIRNAFSSVGSQLTSAV